LILIRKLPKKKLSHNNFIVIFSIHWLKKLSKIIFFKYWIITGKSFIETLF
jgi:hypothetical protein